jgi:hypothetical protein
MDRASLGFAKEDPMRHAKWLVVAAAALVVPWLAGPAPAETPTDAALRDQIQERLQRAEFVDPHDISVRVENGAVTLDGSVVADYERENAEEIATAVDGVRSVENRLIVGKGLGDKDSVPPVGTGPGTNLPQP